MAEAEREEEEGGRSTNCEKNHEPREGVDSLLKKHVRNVSIDSIRILFAVVSWKYKNTLERAVITRHA
jgi:hypothetical protein